VIINWSLEYWRENEAAGYAHVQNQSQDEGVIKTVKIALVLGNDLAAQKFVTAKASAESLPRFKPLRLSVLALMFSV
jgi:hypothetical protein